MPVVGQEAFIVPPRGVQVGPGAVRGVITPSSLVQHGDGGSGGGGVGWGGSTGQVWQRGDGEAGEVEREGGKGGRKWWDE